MRTTTRINGFVASLVSSICLFTAQGYAQQQPNRRPFVLKLGRAYITEKTPVSVDQILTDPRLIFTDTSWHVQSFTLSFQPRGKDFIGPYATKGSKLTEKEIAVFKQLQEDGQEKTRVFIEDIKAYGPDRQMRSMSAVIFNLVKK